MSSLHDPETNKVTLAGYYDNVPELSADEKAELEATMGVDDAAESARLGVGAMGGEAGYTTAERKTVRPTVEIVGLWGGFRDEGIKTVLPSLAHAKVSFRLAEGQVPDEVYDSLVAHVAAVSPSLAPGLSVSVRRLSQGGRAYTADREGVGMRTAGEVLDELFEKNHTTFRQGSSINAVGDFKEILGLDTVSLGFASDADDLIHAPNERFRTSSLTRAQRAYVRMVLKVRPPAPPRTRSRRGIRTADVASVARGPARARVRRGQAPLRHHRDQDAEGPGAHPGRRAVGRRPGGGVPPRPLLRWLRFTSRPLP